MRYDVLYHSDGCVTIEPHFCRDWDENGGCYGTNESHGYTLEEAIDQVAEHYETVAAEWRTWQHPDVKYYLEEERKLASK